MNTEGVGVDRLIEYCKGHAEEFLGRLNRIRVYISHNLTSGTANESILRNFLSELSASNWVVGQGFICNPIAEKPQSSRQCDILIYDRANSPLVHAQGEIAVVWPGAVRMVIEVKTRMNTKAKILEAIENIRSAKAVAMHQTSGLIFAFGDCNPNVVIKELNSVSGELRHRPLAVLLFEKGVVIQQGQDSIDTHWGGRDSPYFARKAKSNSNRHATVLTWLLLAFFQNQLDWGRSVLEGMDIQAAIYKFLNEHMDSFEP